MAKQKHVMSIVPITSGLDALHPVGIVLVTCRTCGESDKTYNVPSDINSIIEKHDRDTS